MLVALPVALPERREAALWRSSPPALVVYSTGAAASAALWRYAPPPALVDDVVCSAAGDVFLFLSGLPAKSGCSREGVFDLGEGLGVARRFAVGISRSQT